MTSAECGQNFLEAFMYHIKFMRKNHKKLPSTEDVSRNQYCGSLSICRNRFWSLIWSQKWCSYIERFCKKLKLEGLNVGENAISWNSRKINDSKIVEWNKWSSFILKCILGTFLQNGTRNAQCVTPENLLFSRMTTFCELFRFRNVPRRYLVTTYRLTLEFLEKTTCSKSN